MQQQLWHLDYPNSPGWQITLSDYSGSYRLIEWINEWLLCYLVILQTVENPEPAGAWGLARLALAPPHPPLPSHCTELLNHQRTIYCLVILRTLKIHLIAYVIELLCGTLLVTCFMWVWVCLYKVFSHWQRQLYRVGLCILLYDYMTLPSTHLPSILQLLLGNMCYHDYENMYNLRFWISLRSCSFLCFTVCISV